MRIHRRAFLGTTVVAAGFLAPASWDRLAGAVRTPRVGLPTASSLTLPLEGAEVVRVHAISRGTLPVTIAYRGETFQVDVLRKDEGGINGVVSTDAFSVFVHNEGDGSKSTGETSELAARALGLALERDAASPELAARLLTFSERAARHTDGLFHAASPVTA